MSRKKIYEDRMAKLGWTVYRLSQEIMRIREARGERPTFQGLESAVRKTISNPDSKSQRFNDDIVSALGGETVIRWQSVSNAIAKTKH